MADTVVSHVLLAVRRQKQPLNDYLSCRYFITQRELGTGR